MKTRYPWCLLLACGLALPLAVRAQNVGIGTTTPDAAAALDITAAGRGLLIPRMDSATRARIGSPPDGLMVFQTDGRKGFWYAIAGAWVFIPDKARSGDNLGNHTATRNLNLAGQLLVGGTAAAPGTSGLSVGSSGNVGIGVAAPSFALDAATNSFLAGRFSSPSPTGTWLNLANTSPGGGGFQFISTGAGNGEGANKLLIYAGLGGGVTGGGLALNGATGNLGIGTSAPAARLHLVANDASRGLQVSDGAKSNLVMQGLAGENSGLALLHFNGYYNGGAQRFNPAKNHWRLGADQRGSTDELLLDTYDGTTTTRVLTAAADGRVGLRTAPQAGTQLAVQAGSGNGLYVGATGNSLTLDHGRSDLVVRPFGNNATVMENTKGALLLNPTGDVYVAYEGALEHTLYAANLRTRNVSTQALLVTRYEAKYGPDPDAHNQLHTVQCSNEFAITSVSVFAKEKLAGYLQLNCAALPGLLNMNGGGWVNGPGPTADNQYHTVRCPDNQIATGWRIQATTNYLDGNVGLLCRPLLGTNYRFDTFSSTQRTAGSTTTGLDYQEQWGSCPPGTYLAGISIYAGTQLEDLADIICTTIN